MNLSLRSCQRLPASPRHSDLFFRGMSLLAGASITLLPAASLALQAQEPAVENAPAEAPGAEPSDPA
jgi:hypothetical protein